MTGRVWRRVPLPHGPGVIWHPTARMMEIVDHAATGLTNEEIAGLCGVAPGTVKAALRTVAEHWSTTDRECLVGEAFRRHYLVGTEGPRVELTEQGAEMARACAHGGSVALIAERLGLRRSAVIRGRGELVEQLEARNIVHAVAIWQARGEADLAPRPVWTPGCGLPRVPAYYMQVLELLAAGATHAQIASRLGVAPSSVAGRIAWLRDTANTDEDAGVLGWAYWARVIEAPPRPPVAATPQIATLLSHLARGVSLQRAAELMRLSEAQVRPLLRATLRLLHARTPTGLVTAAFATGVLSPCAFTDVEDEGLIRPLAA